MRIVLSLRVQVAATCAAVAFALSAAMAGIVGYRAEAQVEREVGHALGMMAVQMAEEMDRTMWSRSGEIATLAELVPPHTTTDRAALRRVIDRFKDRFPAVSWMGVTDADGTVVGSTGGILEGVDIAHRPVYRDGREGLAVGDVHDAVMLARLLPNPTGEPMKFVDVSAPIRDGSGAPVGVLAAHFGWQWAREVERSVLRPLNDREHVRIFVLARDGTVLLGPAGTQGTVLDTTSAQRARAGDSGWAAEDWADGERYVSGFAHGSGHLDYPGLGWSVVVRKPVAIAHASAIALRQEILLWGAGFALAFTVFGWGAATHLTRPLAHICDAAVRLRRGETGAAIPRLRGAREIESLADSLRALVENLTRSRSALATMEDLAFQDRLTGLPNRRFLDTHVPGVTGRIAAAGGTADVLFIDLDGFKAVNDLLGHAAGDAVLRQTGLRMAACLRADDVIARLGGDEFVAVLTTPRDGAPPRLAEVAQRLIDAVGEPMVVDGTSVRIGCSIGMASFPTDAAAFDEVMSLADAALYIAKRAGKNRAVAHGEDEHAAARWAGGAA